MGDDNKKHCITIVYDYYKHNPDDGLRYEYIINEERKTGERISLAINRNPKFKMNIYNTSRCLFIENKSITVWFNEYKELIETTGYTKSVFGGDREDRIIYCEGNYYEITHDVDGEVESEPIWAIINEDGILWDPTQIHNYYFTELDECNKPTGRHFVRSMDINPMSFTYTQIKVVETKISEGIIRTEKDSGDNSNKFINVNNNEDETTLMHTE